MGEKRSVEAISKYKTIAKYLAVKYDITDENVEKLAKRYKQFIEYIS
jgi:Mn-dependent DtxR family transcriptional regulator